MSNISSLVDFQVQAVLAIEKADLNRKNLVFVNWDIAIKLIQRSQEQNEITFTHSGRSGQINLQQAKIRALQEVNKAIETDFIDYFNNKF